jgi:hypothetical protein
MGCCSPFSAVATSSSADPARHVNFTAGMVLGVDDYRQEFAYHSARDKWIVREFLGYGTLSGLAVTVEPDAKGPRVRVTPGAAAAPSGQLICVGREQCGSFNPWLARPEVMDKLHKLTDGTPTPDQTTLTLFLTLCYVDCALAEVPIPGEPCRSDENLMAPSRIADDYTLNFSFDPPPMTEALAVPALDAFWAGLDIAPANANTPAAFATALRLAELQLQLALGVYPADGPVPAAADLGQIQIATAASSRFRTALKALWATKLRPLVAAQRCGGPAGTANDCVLLACLSVPVVRVATHWEVAAAPVGQPTAVTLDQTDRPVLLSTAILQSTFGAALADESSGQTIAFFSAAGTILPATRIAIVRSDAAVSVKLPPADAPSLGKELTVKAGGAGVIKLTTPASTTIDGANSRDLTVRGAVSMISDGANTWHVTGLVQ